ncbi:MAG: phosphoribosylanthranilate isomerase [Elainellaceae cyanobacterium]
MRVKICGITQPEQGRAIAQLGATALGFICVQQSPRYVTPDQIRSIVSELPDSVEQTIDRVGVFVDAAIAEICQVVATGLNVVQLHGNESPEFCQQLRATLPQIEIIKAFRIRQVEDLQKVSLYQEVVNTFLLDAFHPQMLGGTGKTLNWSTLQAFHPSLPWFLAGGLTPENIRAALVLVHPDGIDLSSGLEVAPGDKDLQKVAHLFEQLQIFEQPETPEPLPSVECA